jgi:hypothetical protein
MKDEKRQQFRWAPHTSGATSVKPRDYDDAGALESTNVYSLWAEMKESPEPLEVGDVLELPNGELKIFKYVGFEDARWVLPDVKTGIDLDAPPAAGGRPQAVAARA